MTSAKARQAPSFVRSSGEVIAFCKMGRISPKMRSPFFLHNSPRVRDAVSCCSTSGLPNSDMRICMRIGRISLVARGVSSISFCHHDHVDGAHCEQEPSKCGSKLV